jgi:uncharacterized membrane protein
MMTRLRSYLIILAVSMLPIIELRGSIPIAASLDVSFLKAFPFAVLGNLLPVPFIILFFKYFFVKFRSAPVIGKIFLKVHNKAIEKADQIKSYAFWGLFIFVAIPCPGTGAWTGAVIASILEMNNKKAFLSISLGVVTSGLIMGFISYGLFDIIMSLFK